MPCAHEFLSQDVSVVILGGKMALPDNVERIKDELRENYTIDR